MAADNVVKLFDDNVVPHPSSDVPQFVGMDYERLAAAILDQQDRRKREEKAARTASAGQKCKKPAANGTVDPIRDKKDIARIAQYFHDKGQFRNELMFIIGCSVGLRGEDLSELKVGSFKKPLYQARVLEQKTKKYRIITLNDMAIKAYHALVGSMPGCDDDTYLFQSQRSGNKSISRHSFARVLRQAQQDLQLPYHLGTHSMRKTFAYHVFMDNQKTPEVLAYLQKMLNHRDSATTLRYIGLSAEKEEQLYKQLDFGFTLDDVGGDKP